MHSDLRSRIDALNAAWQERRFAELGEYFHEDARLVAPGLASRIEGRDAIVRTYREFAESATIDSFRLDPPHLEQWGDTAVATSSFTMTYTFGGRSYTEEGHDVLVLARSGGTWVVVWRTVVVREK